MHNQYCMPGLQWLHQEASEEFNGNTGNPGESGCSNKIKGLTKPNGKLQIDPQYQFMCKCNIAF